MGLRVREGVQQVMEIGVVGQRLALDTRVELWLCGQAGGIESDLRQAWSREGQSRSSDDYGRYD